MNKGDYEGAAAIRAQIVNSMKPAPQEKGGPAPTQPAPAAKGPDLNTFMVAARKANPGVSDADLKAYYNSKYK
jgi:cytochrome c551/c552